MKRPLLFASIFTCFVLGAFACKKTEEAPLLHENEIIGTWEVVGFGRGDGKTGYEGEVFDDNCRLVIFTPDKKVVVQDLSTNAICFSGDWAIIDHQGNNLEVADTNGTVEWRVWRVAENQIAVKERGTSYNLLKQ